MAKAAVKTQRNRESVTKFLESVENPARCADAKALRTLMERVTGEKAEMWVPASSVSASIDTVMRADAKATGC